MGPLGVNSVYNKKFDEAFSVSKPTIKVVNLIWGGMYIDITGYTETLNHKTGEKLKINFYEKKGDKNSYVEGFGYDPNGKKIVEISGTWLSEIKVKDLRTGKTQTVWEEGPLVQEAHMQYFFNEFAVQLNQRFDGMEGVVPQTDSRWREDIKIYEEGDYEKADKVKWAIEEEQRRKRKQFETDNIKWQPLYFEQVPHPYLKKGEMETGEETDQPTFWAMKGGDKNYWNKRKIGDWTDAPNLLFQGPFE